MISSKNAAAYAAPSCNVLELRTVGLLCLSGNSETQSYGSTDLSGDF